MRRVAVRAFLDASWEAEFTTRVGESHLGISKVGVRGYRKVFVEV
jgi:hypothetical protein